MARTTTKPGARDAGLQRTFASSKSAAAQRPKVNRSRQQDRADKRHRRSAAARDERPIASIRIGKRYRRDLGDMPSIATVGLLQPVVITPDGRLIDGQRRLEALKKLGHTHAPVHVSNIPIDAIVCGELAANADRKDFTPSELVAITEAVEKRERELARQRQTLGKLSTRSEAGKVRDKINKIAAPLGISARTLEKARAVVQAAKAEPQKFNPLLKQMDDTGRVNGVYKRLCVMKQAAQIRAEPPPLPGRGPYRIIVADPPWPYEIRLEDPSHRGTTPYPQMSLAQIRAMPVAKLAHKDCILWLWTTNYHMRHAYDVLDAWGFQSQTILTWIKHKMGTGEWLRGQTEHCILATRGKPTVHLTNQTTALFAPGRAHSQKPVEFYDFVEKLCPAPRYAYLFSRYRHNNKWDCHGDEAPGADALNTTASTTEAAE
jgi:N6-adenosine-specific RNA methylase IME4